MPTKTNREKYPWDKWFAEGKKSFTLVKGRHYDCMQHSMAQQIRNQAYRRRLSVSVSIRDDSILTKIVGKTL